VIDVQPHLRRAVRPRERPVGVEHLDGDRAEVGARHGGRKRCDEQVVGAGLTAKELEVAESVPEEAISTRPLPFSPLPPNSTRLSKVAWPWTAFFVTVPSS
jgi:hypothetical protein